MIHEIAALTIDPLRAADFESAVQAARPHFEAAAGFVSFALEASIEQPGRYLLIVGWCSVEAHTVDFRNSDGFGHWRALAGPFFAAPPQVEHVRRII